MLFNAIAAMASSSASRVVTIRELEQLNRLLAFGWAGPDEIACLGLRSGTSMFQTCVPACMHLEAEDRRSSASYVSILQ